MTVKKLLVLLVVPIALIALLPLLLSNASEEAAAALGSAIGRVYGLYAGALIAFFLVSRFRKSSS